MQRLLARIIFFLLLAAVGVASWPVFAQDEPGGEKAEKGESGDKKKDEDVSGGRFAGDPVYVHITPMVLPVISDQGLEQIVTVIIDVEVKDYDVAEKMHTNMPRVKDALTRALYGGLGRGNLRDGKLVNVARIKAKATDALSDVVGPGNIREVLVQGVAQRIY